uniref:Putative pyridine nucleotide-disulfide oxidoreductase domain-containing protein 2-like n=2 Tax=Solanum chacoense TaxID=4108 RepID=A0A0V0IHP9_SOLCH
MWRQFRKFSSSSSFSAEEKKWDALIIGGGHNGLTAAAYLARSGLSVAVLERRHIIGGAAVTEELIPGFKFSRCSYLQSLLRPCVIKELELKRHGLKLLKRSPSSFTPLLDGRYLLLGSDKELNYSEISKFSKSDADAYSRYESQLDKFCEFMDPLLDSSTPETLQGSSHLNTRMRHKLQNSAFWANCLRRALHLGQKDLVDLMDLLLAPASKVLNNWFEADVLKVTLATDAVIGSTHVRGGRDGYVEGGMGSVSSAIAAAAKEAGATILQMPNVSKLMIEDTGRVHGVLLADGTILHSSVVLSNATPFKTFMDLVPDDVLPHDFHKAIKCSDYRSATTKINLAVDRLPQFQCCNLSHPDAGPQHGGTIHIGPESIEEMHSAAQDAENGLPSRRPIIEMTIPTVFDKTISPSGKHVIGLFIQYTPYKPSDGSWENSVYRESFAQRCFSMIDEYAPGFSSSIIGYDMLTPPDLEREIGLTGGNIFHGSMGLDSLFLMRPVKGWSNYRTPIEGLYLCGSGTHPGGGVMGAPGRNAAHVVIEDFKKS